MKIRVVAFASAGDIVGHDGLEVTLPEGARLSDLAADLEQRFAQLAALWPRLAVAVNGELTHDDPALTDGAEVALLPPVSGGSGGRPAVLTDAPIELAAVEAVVSRPRRGAVLLFCGNVRDHHQGKPVSHLTYSAYRSMAEGAIERITAELEAAGDDLGVAIVHRLGEVAAGETSVVIAVASPHREAAYAASREALERLKREVPIWKKEHFASGTAEWREVEPLGSASETEPLGATSPVSGAAR